MKFDDILVILGEFGPYQRRVYSLVCLLVLTNSWVSMIQVFLSASVDHHCSVPEWDAYDCSVNGLTIDECEEAKRISSIPHNETSDGVVEFEQCRKYNVSGVDFWPGMDPSNYTTDTTEPIPCDEGWEYDDRQYKSTIVTDFNLVCGKEDLKQISQSVFYGGYLVGSLIFCSLADIIGRWWVLMICFGLRLIAGFGLALSPNWIVFTIMRFLQGCAGVPIYILLFVVGTELVGPSKRYIAGILFVIPFSIGYMLLALLAYFIRYWRTLQMVVTGPVVFFFVIMIFVPESARWLVSSGKYDKAEKIILKAAKTNQTKLPEPIFTDEFKKEQDAIRHGRKPTIIDVFRTPKMRLRTINLILNWMVNAMVYHGLSLNTSNLGVDDYVAFAVSGGVEIPAYLLSIFIIEYFGRRLSLCGTLLLGGVACLCTTFVPSGPALTTVAMIGKFGISASFAIVYLYTAELYPTEIRSVGVGTCSMFSRIAGILAPLILTLEKFWQPLPLVIYGSCTVVVGLLSLFFPETRGRKLPETIEEGENFAKNADAETKEVPSKYSNGKYTPSEKFDGPKSKAEDANETAHTNPAFSVQDKEYP